jgi:alpha-L-fucosidase
MKEMPKAFFSKHSFLLAISFLIPNGIACAATVAKPLAQLQSEFVDWRFGMFLHFGIETFTGDYWVNATPPSADKFTLASVDCDNWAAAAKSAGMKFGVLVAKHHYGFCLWNTSTTTYSSMNAGLKQDIVAKYVTAFRAAGLMPGLYYSILDAHAGIDGSRNAYDRTLWNSKKAMIFQQLRELLTNYGEIPYLILDGWAWRMGHNNIPYQEIREFVKSLQPNCLITDHNGMTEPWENDVFMFEEPKGVYAPVGNTGAAIQGQTINGSWFWTGTGTVKSTADIVDHLTKLQPRYCNFLLNCPPNRSGVLDAGMVTRLAEVGKNWTPATRDPLPAPAHVVEHPVTPIGATNQSGANAWTAIDGFADVKNSTTISQSLFTGSGVLPQSITLDLGAKYNNLEILAYFPRQDQSGGTYTTTGTITGYKVLVSDNNSAFQQVASGTWSGDKKLKIAEWTPPASGRYIRLEATATVGNGNAIVSEITVGGSLDMPTDAASTALVGRAKKAFSFRPGYRQRNVIGRKVPR